MTFKVFVYFKQLATLFMTKIYTSMESLLSFSYSFNYDGGRMAIYLVFWMNEKYFKVLACVQGNKEDTLDWTEASYQSGSCGKAWDALAMPDWACALMPIFSRFPEDPLRFRMGPEDAFARTAISLLCLARSKSSGPFGLVLLLSPGVNGSIRDILNSRQVASYFTARCMSLSQIFRAWKQIFPQA